MNEQLHSNIGVSEGAFFKQDAEGNLLPEGNVSKIELRFREVIERVKERYFEVIGRENIVSIYVSGSVARGASHSGSDLDMFAVVNKNIKDEEIKNLKKRVKNNFRKEGMKVDIGVVSIDQITGEKGFKIRFTLKLMSTCVYGEDLGSMVGNFKINEETARKLVWNVDEYLFKAKENLRKGKPEERKVTCRWIMKIILRNAFHLVLAREGRYTSSLEEVVKILSKYFPEKNVEIQNVFKLCAEPTDDILEIENILDTFGAWVAEQVVRMKNSGQLSETNEKEF